MLVNLLIAMMGDTYTRIAEIKNEWMRQVKLDIFMFMKKYFYKKILFQWARMVLIIERGITPKERLRQQDIYAERMSTGEKALTLKQTMSVCDNLTFEKIV